jgi:hypothetical protein
LTTNSTEIRLAEEQISRNLAEGIQQFLKFKTLNAQPPSSWTLQPLTKYRGPDSSIRYCSPDGKQFSPTGQRAFAIYMRFFGVLRQLGLAPKLFSFVYLADFSLVNKVCGFFKRSDLRTGAAKSILEFSSGILLPGNYIRQHPEFASKLLNPVDPAKWSEWCDKQLGNLRTSIRKLPQVEERAAVSSKPGRSRAGMDVAALLAQQAESVARHLLPNGRLEGNEWFVGSIRGEKGQSLRIHLKGKMAGTWIDFAEPGKRGDLLELWASVRGIAKSEALTEAQQFVVTVK